MKRSRRCTLLLCLAVAPSLSFAADRRTTEDAAALASSRTRAEEQLARGVQEFRAKRYKAAIEAFLAANELYPSAAISFNVARAYDKLGDAAGALRFYRDYLRRDRAAADAAQIRERVEQLEDQLRLKGVQQVTLQSRPTGSTLAVDGRAVGITPWTGELHPGAHQLQLQHEGFQPHAESFELSGLRALDLELELTPLPAASAEPAPTAAAAPEAPPAWAVPPPALDSGTSGGNYLLPWLAMGAAGVAFGGAAYFEFAAASAEEDARSAPRQPDALGHIDDMHAAQTAARVLLGAGAVLAVAGGVYFVLISQNSTDASELALGCGVAACRLQGAF